MDEHQSETEKLRILMDYWLIHNKEHIKENEKWLERVQRSRLNDVAKQLKKVILLSKSVNTHILNAKNLLEGKQARSRGLEGEEHFHETHEHGYESIHRHIELHQIGTIRTPYTIEAPRQPVEKEQGDFRLILNREYEEGLDRLETFRYIYILFYLDRKKTAMNLRVSPPHTKGLQVGLFASRSPHRPNPLGLSIVRVEKIIGNEIFISGIDAYDKTPLLDIKPYMEKLDCKVGAGNGWAEKQDNTGEKN
jgi:tRNA-Thr(GGU) m(6)t(6)A37 methyltransferase TsaA